MNNKLEIVARLADNTYDPADRSGTFTLKPVIQGDQLVLKFATIVHFAAENYLRPQIDAERDRARKLIREFLKKLRADFKKETSEKLTLKTINGDDNIEVISATANSLRKIAYYRYNEFLQIK